jgi:hypothetical protein
VNERFAWALLFAWTVITSCKLAQVDEKLDRLLEKTESAPDGAGR